MSLKSQTRDPQPGGFLRPKKTHRPQTDLNPRTLDLEASTLLRDHRGRQPDTVNFNFSYTCFRLEAE